MQDIFLSITLFIRSKVIIPERKVQEQKLSSNKEKENANGNFVAVS